MSNYWVQITLLALCFIGASMYIFKSQSVTYHYFMYGYTFSLAVISKRPLWFILGMMILGLLSYAMLSRLKLLSYEGDRVVILWLVYGFALLGFDVLVGFYAVFIMLFALFSGLKLAYRLQYDLPIYPTLLSSFIVTTIIYHLL